jgi:phage baseplate assembly protein W
VTRRYGRHLSFPFRVGADGRTAQVTREEEHVRDELVQLLLTTPGERAFVPDFGGGVRRLVFEPADPGAQGMVKATITQAISNWLGHRVSLEALDVSIVESTITVDVAYRLAGNQETRVLRFQREAGAP